MLRGFRGGGRHWLLRERKVAKGLWVVRRRLVRDGGGDFQAYIKQYFELAGYFKNIL